MPASTSSNTSVGMRSPSTRMVLSASMMRESSPPDAILASGFGSSPGFGEIRNSTRSAPRGPEFMAVQRIVAWLLRDLDRKDRLLHAEMRKLCLDFFLQVPRCRAPLFRQSCACEVSPDLIVWISFCSRSISSVLRSMRSSSAAALFAEGNDLVDGAAVFFFELLDQVQPVADLLQPVGIELHASRHRPRLRAPLLRSGRVPASQSSSTGDKPVVDGCDLAKVGDRLS